MVFVCGVDFFVFGFIAWAHVPIKAIFEARGFIIVIYALELSCAACEGAVCLNKVGFGFGDEPVRERLGNICCDL